MNLRSLAARRDPDCTDRRTQNSADHRIWGCLVAAMGAAMTKATGVIKGDRLTMALITLAVRGKRPRCSGSVDHVLRTSDDQRDRAIAAPVAKS